MSKTETRDKDADNFVKKNFLYFAVVIIMIGTIVNALLFVIEYYGSQDREFIIKQNQILEAQNNQTINGNMALINMASMIIRGQEKVIYEVQEKDARELIEQNFINGLLSYQNRLLLEEFAKQHGLELNNKVLFNDIDHYPYYEANNTHITIHYDENNITSIDIPEPLLNLVNPLESTNSSIKSTR